MSDEERGPGPINLTAKRQEAKRKARIEVDEETNRRLQALRTEFDFEKSKLMLRDTMAWRFKTLRDKGLEADSLNTRAAINRLGTEEMYEVDYKGDPITKDAAHVDLYKDAERVIREDIPHDHELPPEETTRTFDIVYRAVVRVSPMDPSALAQTFARELAAFAGMENTPEVRKAVETKLVQVIMKHVTIQVKDET